MLKQKSNWLINTIVRLPLLALIFIVLASSVLVSLAVQRQAEAATNATLNFQARLLTGAGSLVPDGNYNVEFKLYNASSSSGSSQGSCSGDTACLWTETRVTSNKVRVVNGYLTVNLGSVTAFSSSINWDQELWLTMNVGGTGTPGWDGEMNPRLKLTAVPYAFRAGTLATQNGANTSTLSFTAPSATRTINIPDESGTLCVQNSVNCGFALSTGSGNYIQNGTSIQAANFAIQSNAATTAITALLKLKTSQTGDLIQLQDASANPLGGINNNGRLYYTNSGFNGLLDIATLSTNQTYTLPNASGTFCLTSGNCAGVGGTGDILNNGQNGPLVIGTNDNTTLTLETNNTPRVIIQGGGNVGIGSTPSYPLDVTGDVNTSTQYHIGGTVICTSSGCTPSAGSSNYIQNQSASDQTANFRISGTGRANTSLLTPLLDTATGVTLGIGTTNATAINLNQHTTLATNKNLTFAAGTGSFDQSASSGTFATSSGAVSLNGDTTLATGKTLTVQGAALFKNNADSSTAFRVQNAGSSNVFLVDTSNTLIRISGAGSDATLTSGTGAVQIGADNAANLAFDDNEIIARNNGGTSTLFLQGNGGGLTVGATTALFKNTSDSTEAFKVQNAAGTLDVLDVDTQNGYVGIGTAAPATGLEVARGPLNSGASFNFNILSSDTTAAAQNVGGGIGFGGNADVQRVFASIQGFHESATASDYAGALRFYTRPSGGGSLVERMRISSIGRAGLGGNTNPQYALDVTGDINASGVYRAGSTAGVAVTCSGGQLLQNATSVGGIVTGGSCVAPDGSGVTVVGTIDSQTKSSNGAVISGSNIYLQTADASSPGLVSTGAQTFAGNKTLSGVTTLSRNGAGTGDYSLGVTGTPINDGTSSLVRLGNAIASGNASANGGTYLGINAPSSGAGSAADFVNFQNNNNVQFRLSSSGNLTVNGTYNTNTFTSSALTFGNASAASIQSASGQALNITGHGASTFSTDNGLLTLQGTGGVSLLSANGTSSSAVTIQSGNASSGASGNIAIDNGTFTSGTPTISLGGTNAKTIQIGNTTNTSTIDVDSAASGTINIGTGAQARTINIGTGGAAQTIFIGSSSQANLLTMGSTSSSSATTIQAGTGGLSLLTNSASASIIARSGTDNASAFQVQNATNVQILTVDTSAGSVVLGKTGGSGLTGKLVFNNATNANTITLQSGTTGSNLTLTLPTADGASSNCLKTDGAGVLSFAACGSSSGTLQGMYTAQAASDIVDILLDSSRKGIDIQDANTTIGSTAALFAVRASNAGVAGSMILGARGDGNVGLGVTAANATSVLTVVGASQPTGSGTNGANATQVLQVTGGNGGNGGTTSVGVVGKSGGTGSSIVQTAGNGGSGGAGNSSAGGVGAVGGNVSVTTGNGGNGGAGSNSDGGSAAAGGALTLQSGSGGNGGNGSVGQTGGNGGNGGTITIQGGAGGTAGTATSGTPGTAGARGNVIMQASGGNVGIGTSNPGQELEVNGDIRLDLNGTVTTNGVCHSGAASNVAVTDRDLVVCNGSSSDIAEWYEIKGMAEAGDVVSLSNENFTYEATKIDPFTGQLLPGKVTTTIAKLEKSRQAYQSKLLGVISSSPNKVIGGDIKDQGQNPMPIALKGRVPVKVTNENGVINPGDPLTSSSTPGFAMKATQAGPIIGRALGSLNGRTGLIEVFVESGYYTPPFTLQVNSRQYIQNGDNASFANLNISGLAEIQKLTVRDTITSKDLTVTGTATTASLKVTGSAEFAGDISLTGVGQSRNAITKRFKASKPFGIGSIVIADPNNDGQVTTTTLSGDTKVLGVALTAAGNSGDEVIVAIGGSVQAKVVATTSIITGGDLLISSAQEGAAEKSQIPAAGSIVGKALGKVDPINGQVWILITLQ